MIAPRNGHDEEPPVSWMMERSNLFGRVGMILCWYWDGADDEGEEQDAVRGVRLLPDLLRGDTEGFAKSDWWIFYDALGVYPHRDDELDEVYELAADGYNGRLPAGPTKRFPVEGWDDAEDDGEE